ncbi:MAG: recombinase family protein, partial [Anaerolinea sp.]|nr:recombinase family protein [Anaerolinea sp.]
QMSYRFKQIHSLEKRKKYMEKHPFGLIVWKSNRIGRDSIETTYIKSDLRLRGITIIHLVSAAETSDPTTNALFEVLQQSHDEKALEELSDNSRRGLADHVGLQDNDPAFRCIPTGPPMTDATSASCPASCRWASKRNAFRSA